jgi:hypothetical protein
VQTVERRATDDEVATWRRDGWVLLDGLIGTGEIDAATPELAAIFPSAEEYHADAAATRARWLGHPAPKPQPYVWPAEGPGFRPEQHIWAAEFPFSGARLGRLAVHPAVVDFAERALATRDIRLYQAQLSAKYAGLTNYEQPMHTDRNHSWLPPFGEPMQLQLFLYLSDVDDGNAPTHLVPRTSTGDRSTNVWGAMPNGDPELYAAERPAPGRRGSVLAYRNDVFHRGVDLVAPGTVRYILGTGFKVAGVDWIGYHAWQSRATGLEWTQFAEGSTPRELELLGFPPPGAPIWSDALLDATAERYPKLDLAPWRAALSS